MTRTIRRLTYEDKHLLAMLSSHLDAFPEEVPDDTWRQITDDKLDALLKQCGGSTGQLLLGAFELPSSEPHQEGQLVGMVGLRRELRPTIRHKASLWGLTVLPGKRRQGVGNQLVAALLEEAEQMPELEMLRLVVLTQNTSALPLLHKHGFETYAVEPRARRIDGIYYDQSFMYRRVSDKKENQS